jgi:hypothetical protein
MRPVSWTTALLLVISSASLVLLVFLAILALV